MRRAKFSWIAHWREQYALGEITVEQLEGLVEIALRAEALTKRPKADTSPQACAERWSAAASRAAASYSTAVAALPAKPA